MHTIYIHWDTDQKQLIIAEFNQSWTWDEFHETVQQIHRMVTTVSHMVDVIIWHKVELPPGNPITHLSRTLKKQPSNLGKTVVVTPQMNNTLSNFLKTIASIIERAYPNSKKVLSADSIEHARAILGKNQVQS